MVVKIPVLVNGAKAAVSNEIIETPGTNTTEITPEKKSEIAAVAAEKKAATAENNTFTYHEIIQHHFPRHQSKSNTNDDSNIGDNSSISSRSSMNSMPNSLDRGEANPTTYVAALKAAAAASTRPSPEDAATVSSPSDHSREHIDHPYASPESLQLDDEPQPHQNLNTSRSLSFVLPPRPSSPDNSLDWQFSGNMENFFEENDRTAGLSSEHEAENENTDDACPLERCQLESFDSAERKLLLRESSNAGGSGTSSSTHKITNRSSDRMPMPSPSGQVGTTPLAPPSIGDIFSSGTKGSTPIVLPKRKGNMFGPPCEPSPSGLFLNIPATNSFSDLLTTSNDNEDRPETVEPTTDQDTKASGDNKETKLKKKESDESDKPQYDDIMNTLKDAEEIELQPPTPLGSDHAEGPRRFIIDGAMKTCTNYSIDQISSNGTDGSFYHFLQALSPAFEGCTFLLPWLRQSETKVKVNVSLLGGFKLSQGTLIRPMQAGPSPKDLANAKRRIQSTICAFGGSINSKKENEDDVVEKLVTFTKDTSKSIFRSRSCSPSSTSSSKSAGQKRKREIKSIMRREKYEETLRDQYFENGDRLSWDVQHSIKLSLSGAKTFDEEDNSDTSSSKQDDAEADIVASADIEVEKRPIRYKCTLCGALKKKHVCANRPTILRSIGVNVYPAVNAYTADEPGDLATPLSQMNNFIPLSNRNSCQLTTDEDMKKMKATQSAQIQDTSITPNDDPVVNLIFRPRMEITSDQYLDVKAEPTARDYLYPDVPLTSAQRKSMSDALLSMSRSVPQLTHACAMVLKDARKGNKWDQAVAELMAQVLCILKCSLSKDYSLDGLRRYLLEVGVSC